MKVKHYTNYNPDIRFDLRYNFWPKTRLLQYAQLRRLWNLLRRYSKFRVVTLQSQRLYIGSRLLRLLVIIQGPSSICFESVILAARKVGKIGRFCRICWTMEAILLKYQQKYSEASPSHGQNGRPVKIELSSHGELVEQLP